MRRLSVAIVGSGGLGRQAGPDARDGRVVVRRAVHVVRLRWLRHPDLRRWREVESGRHHADDLVRLCVDDDVRRRAPRAPTRSGRPRSRIEITAAFWTSSSRNVRPATGFTPNTSKKRRVHEPRADQFRSAARADADLVALEPAERLNTPDESRASTRSPPDRLLPSCRSRSSASARGRCDRRRIVSGFRSRPSTTLKMAVVAPMPSASVSAATAVKPARGQHAHAVAQVLHRGRGARGRATCRARTP